MTDADSSDTLTAMEPRSDTTGRRSYSVAEYREMVAALDKAPAKPSGRKGGGRKPKPALTLPKPVRLKTVAATIARVLHFTPLRNLKLAPEEQLAIAFANALRQATMEGRLRAVWTHPANEIAGRRSGLSQIRYAIAKAMGLISGTPDYLFLASHRSAALEAKVPGNDQQDNQKDFEFWCRCVGVEYRVFTSVEQGLSILEELGLLTRDADKGRETLAAWERLGAGDA